MKVIVIGLGSMGTRRIRLIQKYDSSIQIVGIDTNIERRVSCSKEYNIKTFSNLSDISTAEASCAFICTSPLSHHKIISQCLLAGMHVFTELNLVSDGYEENIALAKQKNLVLFLSSTFLYRDEIKQIKSSVADTNCSLNYIYHVGQYLPDWHPWENYQDFFISDKRTNGCREIFAIELPWIIDIFGDIVSMNVVKNKISELDIDYQDNYLAIFQHSKGHKGTLVVDVVSRKAVRNLEVYGEQLYLTWDGSPSGLKIYDYDQKVDKAIDLYKEIDQLDNYSHFVVENAYLNEIVSFFGSVKDGKPLTYSFMKDLEILKVIDEIES
ncbi:Gfo/Idh/MocA family protein [Ornithinibacillus scapharcae]|uniref:Gfo/Idh/MocA family protein n=1 Tax=Ornithinibacillus scapharcae TaxID=1147159 RepID=UPI000225AB37|nr:Gfo/Idh/MocA family oxidoreductase [Ornithinibacillus scapharcae]